MKDLRLFLIIVVMFLFSCRSPNISGTMRDTFEKEIKNRREILLNLPATTDSLSQHTINLDKNIEHLLLLSKDIENLQACVNRADDFFREESHYLGIDYSKFERLNKGMSTNEIELILKRNELVILNCLVFQNNGEGIQLLGVREEAP